MAEQKNTTFINEIRELATDLTAMINPDKKLAYVFYAGMKVGKKVAEQEQQNKTA